MHVAAIRSDLADDDFSQRAFAYAVCADDGDFVVLFEFEAKIFKQNLVVCFTDAAHFQDLVADVALGAEKYARIASA